MQSGSMHVAVNGGGGRAADVWSRGTKRSADDSSNTQDFERFEKRLRMLSIRNATKQDPLRSPQLYTPITHHHHHPAPPSSTLTDPPSHASHVRHHNNRDSDMMAIDPTSSRVFIHDLDAELDDVESDEEKLIFLPDIEKKLSKLPAQILNPSTDDHHHDQELVLYSVPRSLTVDENHDSVRKAIIEARQRARETALRAEEARAGDMEKRYDHTGCDYNAAAETAHGYGSGYTDDVAVDPDAMDIG